MVLRNEADSLAYQTEKTLHDAADKAAQGTKDKVEKAINDGKQAFEGDNIEEIKQKKEALTEELGELSSQLYADAQKQAQQQTGQQAKSEGNEENSTGDDDQTVDVDYEEVDDEE